MPELPYRENGALAGGRERDPQAGFALDEPAHGG